MLPTGRAICRSPGTSAGRYAWRYASSATQDASGTLYVELYADGALVGQATVPGERIRQDPTALSVQVLVPEGVEATRLTLQVASKAIVSSGGAGNPRDGHVTLFFGSVQVPARITLP